MTIRNKLVYAKQCYTRSMGYFSYVTQFLIITANIKSAETKDIHSGAVDCRNEMRLWKKMTAAGMSNSEFIKMDPNYLNKSTPIKKKGKKAKVEEYSLDDIMEEESSEQLFEENDD